MIKYKPYRERRDQYNVLFEEIVYFFCYFFVFILAIGNSKEKGLSSDGSAETGIGWVIISLTLIVLLVSLGLILYQSFLNFKSVYKNLKERRSKKYNKKNIAAGPFY